VTVGELAGTGTVATWRARMATDELLRGSAFIMATSVVTSLIGYAFWLLVDHRYPAAVSGAGAAAASLLQATALLASAGAGAAMMEWLPRSRSSLEWRQRLTAGLVVAAAAAAAGGVLTVVVVGHLLHTLAALETPMGAGLFCLGGVILALGVVLDDVAICERRGGVMLVRNTVFVAARIPLLAVPWLWPGTGDQILTAWIGAAGVSLVVSVVAFRFRARHVDVRPAFGALGAQLREMAGSFVGQHLTTIAAMLGAYLMPILVVARVSPAANAYFYATWMLGSVFFMISPAVSAALFAEAAIDSAGIEALARRCVVTIAALLAVPAAVSLFAGGLLLELFGPDYPSHGRLLLVLLTVSAVPDAVTNVAVSVLRATGRVGEAFLLNAGMLLGYLALAWWLLTDLGIVGAGISWVVVQSAGAVWALAHRRRIVTPVVAPVVTPVVAAGQTG
jgi:O-antigen/teichoic acid export membrane protein